MTVDNLQEILYLELESGSVLRKFEGHDQGQYVLRSCFGGATENFVLSGSAGTLILAPFSYPRVSLSFFARYTDGKIVVYHRDTGRLLYKLEGHDLTTVNAVAWNPDSSRAMWASCSDDRTIRIWEMSPADAKEAESGGPRRNRLRPLSLI